MSRDGLLPKSFAKINKKTEAPTVFSTWLTGIGSALIAGFIDLKELSNLANIGALVNICDGRCVTVIILRKTHPNLKRGFSGTTCTNATDYFNRMLSILNV
ncbi:amino acid permease [Bacillus tropicus]|uniref:amino acid permease n=1 Tax=Bacillus tropicus TaxID=2026188 RepID=UPI0013E00D9A|nr:amino acid permease [Bacillus tropicus]